MKKGDKVIWDNEPDNIAKIYQVYPNGNIDIKYQGSKGIVTVSISHLKKV